MNDVVLHTDERLLPQRPLAWSSWNYRIREGGGELPVLSYDMNILQRIESPHTFVVTLNDSDAIDPSRVLGRFRYSHPVFTVEGIAAQQRWDDVNGSKRTWYCGAWWGNGFHEDGVASARRVAAGLGVQW
jgi:predicted NAD/FAD-binding protein